MSIINYLIKFQYMCKSLPTIFFNITYIEFIWFTGLAIIARHFFKNKKILMELPLTILNQFIYT